MASLAWIVCDQVCTKLEDVDLVWGTEVFFAVDRAGDDGCEITQTDVLEVAEIPEELSLVLFAETR
jgi:hypothetical protein